MRAAVLAAALLLAPPAAAEQLTGALPNGATWVIDTPRNWNGALLLYSHGYAMGPANPARNAPDAETRESLGVRLWFGESDGLRRLQEAGSQFGTVILSRPEIAYRYRPVAATSAPPPHPLVTPIDRPSGGP